MNTQEVIDAAIGKAKDDLQVYIDECKKQGKTLCDLKIDWDNPLYIKKEIQYLYMLRYFYAYLLEFKWLFGFVELEQFKIFSVGCGAYIDLLGLNLSNKSLGKNVKYVGIDPADWEYRNNIKSMLPDDYQISYCQQKFEDYAQTPGGQRALGEANVIIFPKSIEYMDTSVWAKIVEEADFQENIIYLIMNAMDFDYRNDEFKLDYLKQLFENKGYIAKKNLTKSPAIPQYCIRFPGEPKYHQDIYSWLPQIYSQCIVSKECADKEDCYLYKFNSPMVKTDSFQYKIYRLEKNDSQCQ